MSSFTCVEDPINLNSTHDWLVLQDTANRGLNVAFFVWNRAWLVSGIHYKAQEKPLPQCGTFKYPLNLSLRVPGDPENAAFLQRRSKAQLEWQARQCWVMWRNAESEEHLPQNSQRSGALAWMFLAAGGSSAVGGVPGLVRWLWGNQPLFPLSESQAWPLTDCQQLWEEEQQMPATEKPPALQLNQSQLSRDGPL